MLINEENLKNMSDNKGLCHIDAFIDFFSWIDEDFNLKWQDSSDYGHQFEGVLVLAFTGLVPPLKPIRQWHAIQHQHGGCSCRQICMIATRLRLRPEVLPVLDRIARDGFGAQGGWFNQDNLSDARHISYVSLLNAAGLSCERSWRHLSESLYPIDATQENLHRIAEDAPKLDDLADWTNTGNLRNSPDLTIFYVVENSD